MTERQRILSVLKRQKPDRIPWATRLDIWYTSNKRTNTLPADLEHNDITQMHKALKVGRQAYVPLTTIKLNGVEVIA